MSSLAGLALRPFERRIAIVFLYLWIFPNLVLRIREYRRRKKQRADIERELARLRDLNRELEAHVQH